MDQSPDNFVVLLMMVLSGLGIGGSAWWFLMRDESYVGVWHFIGLAAAMVIGGFFLGAMLAIFWPIVLFLVALAAVITGLGLGLKSAHFAWRNRHRHSR